MASRLLMVGLWTVVKFVTPGGDIIPEAIMRKALCLALLVVAASFSGGCYVTQDANGQWFACEDYQAQNGIASACTPIQAPF